MKVFLYLLLFPALLFSQEKIKDSATASGRYAEFKLGQTQVVVDAKKPINEFKLIQGMWTSDGTPYFGIKYFKYEQNSDVTLREIYWSDYKKNFDNADLIDKNGSLRIEASKVSVSNNKRVFEKVYTFPLSDGGLAYLLFMIPLEGKTIDQAAEECAAFMKYLSYTNHFYKHAVRK